MKKETSGHKHKPSEPSTHPKVPSPKAMHPHLAHISSAVLLQLPDLVTDLRTTPAFSSLWPGTAVKVGVLLCALNKGRWPGPPSAKEFSELSALPSSTTGVSSRAVGKADILFCEGTTPASASK